MLYGQEERTRTEQDPEQQQQRRRLIAYAALDIPCTNTMYKGTISNENRWIGIGALAKTHTKESSSPEH
jgi:hypothetical protein